jgi:N-terminal half of MaoC dehydratase
MPIDEALVGRSYPPTRPYAVSEEKVREFARATGVEREAGEPIPATFPIVLAFDAMNDFLAAEDVALHRIVHGDQKFHYERPVRVGDVLSATLTVASLRQIAGNDIIGTASEIRDASGALVVSSTATLVHRGGDA